MSIEPATRVMSPAPSESPARVWKCKKCERIFKSEANHFQHFFCVRTSKISQGYFVKRALRIQYESEQNFKRLNESDHIDGTVKRDSSQGLRVVVHNKPSQVIQTVLLSEPTVPGQVESPEDKHDPSSSNGPRDRSVESWSDDSSGGDPLDDRFDVPTLRELQALRAGTARKISSVPPETEFHPNRQSASRRCAIL